MKKLACFLLMAFVLIFQTTALSRMDLYGVRPEVILGICIPLAVLLGPVSGAVTGLLCGLIMEVLFPHQHYLAFHFMLSGVLGGLLGERMYINAFAVAALTFLCVAIKEIFILAVIFFEQVQMGGMAIVIRLLSTCLFQAILAGVVYLLLKRLFDARFMQFRFIIVTKKRKGA
jgi:uncharacterized membrane protein